MQAVTARGLASSSHNLLCCLPLTVSTLSVLETRAGQVTEDEAIASLQRSI